MELIINSDFEELSREMAGWMTGFIRARLEKKDRFSLVLSGGSTPRSLYQVLASPAFSKKLKWDKIDFFWGDERHVPFDDERNNAKMAWDTLLSKIPVKTDQVFRIPTNGDPAEDAMIYEKTLRNYLDALRMTGFDLVLLGLGDNGHTLSLFPGTAVLSEKDRWVSSFFLEEQKMHRITLTAPIINRSSAVAFLVSGSGKANAVHHVLEDVYSPVEFPAQLIQPDNGQLYWWIDEAAAQNLSIIHKGGPTK
jgi:6-phosphogluconolactonase